MRSGTLPVALLSTALGLALVSASPRARLGGSLALVGSAALAAIFPTPPDSMFIGCWISVTATAAVIYFCRQLQLSVAVALSVNAGLWAGVVSANSMSQLASLSTLPCVLIWLPAAALAARYGAVPLKVASSWIIAVAVITATLQMLPVTPGYLPDHME